MMTKEEAITILDCERPYGSRGCGATDEEIEEALNMAIEALGQERKTGHWIDGHCSECGCDVPAYIVDWRWIKDMDAKYCPNCGARMESEVQP